MFYFHVKNPSNEFIVEYAFKDARYYIVFSLYK